MPACFLTSLLPGILPEGDVRLGGGFVAFPFGADFPDRFFVKLQLQRIARAARSGIVPVSAVGCRPGFQEEQDFRVRSLSERKDGAIENRAALFAIPPEG